MKTRMFATALALAAGAAALHAQTPVTFQPSSSEQSQIQAFENALRTAIAKAGAQLAARAREVAPNIQLQFDSDARVKGVVLPDSEGTQFFVDVPGIRPETVGQWDLARLLRLRESREGVPASNSTSEPVRTTTAAVPANSVLMTDPPKEYSGFIHDALVDAILDAGFNLPLKDGQALTLIVGNGTSGLPQNPLAEQPKLLFLRIKSEDLAALRQNRITRDEAKSRIRQWVY
ncbi:MAG TPA: hypothetical protein VFV78_14740 [Vicinamibacterales bacterium]|nr:hypothetical protein [Vicinamibacterales bacterium]